jgi:hypothetical protein
LTFSIVDVRAFTEIEALQAQIEGWQGKADDDDQSW